MPETVFVRGLTLYMVRPLACLAPGQSPAAFLFEVYSLFLRKNECQGRGGGGGRRPARATQQSRPGTHAPAARGRARGQSEFQNPTKQTASTNSLQVLERTQGDTSQHMNKR